MRKYFLLLALPLTLMLSNVCFADDTAIDLNDVGTDVGLALGVVAGAAAITGAAYGITQAVNAASTVKTTATSDLSVAEANSVDGASETAVETDTTGLSDGETLSTAVVENGSTADSESQLAGLLNSFSDGDSNTDTTTGESDLPVAETATEGTGGTVSSDIPDAVVSDQDLDDIERVSYVAETGTADATGAIPVLELSASTAAIENTTEDATGTAVSEGTAAALAAMQQAVDDAVNW